MTTHNPPAPESATLPRLVRDGVAAYRQDNYYGWYGMLRNGERAALYEEALCAYAAVEVAAIEVVRGWLARLSEEEIP